MVEVTDAVGTLVECDGKILILQRKYDNYLGGNWDIPGGRLKPGELHLVAMKRELREEVGFITRASTLEQIKIFNWDIKNESIIFRTFRLKVSGFPEVKLNPKEHTDYKWITPKECYAMQNLINGFYEILEEVYLLNE